MTLPAETLTALKESIAHWERNVAAERSEDASAGVDDCALCGLFFLRRCAGCPIAENTGSTFCNGTPYQEAEKAFERWYASPTSPEAKAEFVRAATAMLDFLKSLLPEDE